MKLMLRLSIFIFALFTGLHMVAIIGMEVMAAPGVGMSMTGEAMPGSCETLCVLSSHIGEAVALPQLIHNLLPLLVALVILVLIVPILRRLGRTGLSYIARPPDIILLYGHCRI